MELSQRNTMPKSDYYQAHEEQQDTWDFYRSLRGTFSNVLSFWPLFTMSLIPCSKWSGKIRSVMSAVNCSGSIPQRLPRFAGKSKQASQSFYDKRSSISESLFCKEILFWRQHNDLLLMPEKIEKGATSVPINYLLISARSSSGSDSLVKSPLQRHCLCRRDTSAHRLVFYYIFYDFTSVTRRRKLPPNAAFCKAVESNFLMLHLMNDGRFSFVYSFFSFSLGKDIMHPNKITICGLSFLTKQEKIECLFK